MDTACIYIYNVNHDLMETVFPQRRMLAENKFAMIFAGISKPKKCRRKEHDKVVLHPR